MEVRTMSASSPISVLPRPADPAYVPSQAEREHSLAVHALERAIVAIVTGAHFVSPAERSVIVAEALSSLEMDGISWCADCQASRTDGFCYDHAQGLGLIDAFRRHAYSRLPGRPLIDVDL
jgi:hypothetical protein